MSQTILTCRLSKAPVATHISILLSVSVPSSFLCAYLGIKGSYNFHLKGSLGVQE